MFFVVEEIKLGNSVLTIKAACGLFVSVHMCLESFQNQKCVMKVVVFLPKQCTKRKGETLSPCFLKV